LQKPCETDELMQVLEDAYRKHVQHKLKVDEDKMQQLLGSAQEESPLGILRKLRQLGEEKS
jgi:hypothetical protein